MAGGEVEAIDHFVAGAGDGDARGDSRADPQPPGTGAYSRARMCVTCTDFRPDVNDDPVRPHHCAFVDAAFGDGETRVDCADFVPVSV